VTDDDDIVRRALTGSQQPVDAHRALEELRPSMRRAQIHRRIAAVAATAVIVTGGGAAALTIAGSPDAPTMRTFPTATADSTAAAVSTTIGITDPPGPPGDASSIERPTTSGSPHPTTTEPAAPVRPPQTTEPRVVEPPSPPAVTPMPSTSLSTPEPPAEPEPTPTTPAAATSTTITSRCGQIVVTIENGQVFIASISPLSGFDASVTSDGPTSVELRFTGDAGTCEIHAELERGTLDVEVQNPNRDD
jgi:hypothetical protein